MLAALILLAFRLIAAPTPAHAEAPALQIHPLEYRDALTAGHIKTGYVEVANPSDATVVIESSVRGFRQTGTDGALEFFDDPELAAGITVGLTDFELGPREAIRVGFNVDASKLPAGGVYAALFFRTVPPPQGTGSSYVAESANIGTLLELINGPAGPHQGEISSLSLPFWQFGRGLTGGLSYHNTDRTAHPLGFRPNLSVKVLPWGKTPKLNTGLVLPGSTRHFDIRRTGSFFGLLPITITDTDTKKAKTAWVFACTGWYQWLLVVLAILAIVAMFIRPRLRRKPKPKLKRPLDGLAPKSKS